MPFYIRFLVEEAEYWDAPAAARWLRRSSPHWSKRTRVRWQWLLAEPYVGLLVDLLGDTWLRMTHIWSKRWNAPIYFFLCSYCYRRVRRLIRLNEEDAWACRQCHRAKYASQLQSVRGQGIAHFHVLEYLEWLSSRPGPRTRSMKRLIRKAECTEVAFKAKWDRLAKRLGVCRR